jgi:hypothetical protein
VNDSEFEKRLARLIEDLDQSANLLRDHGEDLWLGWVTLKKLDHRLPVVALV